MDNEHDSLDEFDLSAWEVPAPQPDLADAVIARIADPVGAPALEPEQRSRKWWFVASGGALVASAAVIAIVVARGAHHAASGHGEIVATRPQHLDLDTVSADLDAGATLSWKRDRDSLAVHQTGSATWRVADDEHLRIETGVMVPPIEATGASLRVEAHMNLSDIRVVGASAAAAAAVAFVTVVVYEGHVRVGNGGQTVTVEPNTMVELRANQPPEPPDLVGTGAREQQLEDQLKQLRDENAKLRQQAVGGGGNATCDEVSCELTSYAGTCCAKLEAVATRDLAPAQVKAATATKVAACDAEQLTDQGRASINASNFTAALASFEASLECKQDPAVEKLAFMAACQSGSAAKAKRYFDKIGAAGVGTLLQVCLRAHIDPRAASAPPSQPACDAQDLAEKGRANINVSAYAAALANFEAAIKCHPEPSFEKLAFLAACQANAPQPARKHYLNIGASNVGSLIMACTRNHIDPTVDDSAANAPIAQEGYLEVISKPPAKVRVDGNDTGMTTPIKGHRLALTPGKHKVTFVVGVDRFTYVVQVEAGETVTMSKHLQ